MPTFIQIKKWIIEEAALVSAEMTVRRAKALAGEYMTTIDPDAGLRYSTISHSDPVAEAAVKAWFKAMAS